MAETLSMALAELLRKAELNPIWTPCARACGC